MVSLIILTFIKAKFEIQQNVKVLNRKKTKLDSQT